MGSDGSEGFIPKGIGTEGIETEGIETEGTEDDDSIVVEVGAAEAEGETDSSVVAPTADEMSAAMESRLPAEGLKTSPA